MRPGNLLPALRKTRATFRGPWAEGDAERADEVVYRLGLQALPVPGLPEAIEIDDVSVAFVPGPVRAQRTEMRQRHGLPVIFDKRMTREDVGSGELVAILWIRSSVPEDLLAAFSAWRPRALAAAGVLAAVLDERVAGRELFEDAILLRNGSFLGAADRQSEVRTFLPFEVNAADAAAIDQLAAVSLSEASAVTRAARLYRRAALEGPTADAFAMLWVAAECFSAHRSPSRKDIESALAASGLDPERLPIRVGRLIELRGKIQHHGLEEDDRLQLAFYEMEAVVRSLIRLHATIGGGWWAAPDNPAGFAEPFDAATAAHQGPGTTEWHRDSLPPIDEPVRLGLPRRVVLAATDPRLDLDPQLGEATELVANAVIDAIEWQDPNTSLAIRVGAPPDAPPEVGSAADPGTIWLPAERLDGVDDPNRPEVLVNLVWDLHSLAGAALAQREGLASEGDGIVVVEAIGAWSQYQRLVVHGQFDASLLQIPVGHDQISLGKVAGWAAAGDTRAEAAAKALAGRDGELVRDIISGLRSTRPGPPTHILEVVRARPATSM